MSGYISQPSNTARILKDYEIVLKKSFGQNFLIDTNVLKKIVKMAELGKDDIVLEIGSGIGSLTEVLLPEIKRIICIEIDPRLSRAFEDLFGKDLGKKIVLLSADALRIDYGILYEKYGFTRFVANLPYKIAAPLILRVFLEAKKLEDAVLTIQKDIAERILARPGEKNYSAYTVKASFLFHVEKSYQVSKHAFLPKPNVDSTTIKVKRNPPDARIKDVFGFFQFIDSCFSHRRKKLVNSMIEDKVIVKNDARYIFDMLKKMSKDEKIRAQDLVLSEFIHIFQSLKTKKFF